MKKLLLSAFGFAAMMASANAQTDATLVSLEMTRYVGAGDLDIAGEIENNGSTEINSISISWNDGSGPQVDNLTNLGIDPGDDYDFTHSIPLTVVAGTAYTINVDITVAGDVNTGDNTLSADVVGLTFVPTKVVIGEERTGTWCGFCPRGAVAMAGMESDDSFIGIAVHKGDPMELSVYNNPKPSIFGTSFPKGGVDRVEVGDAGDLSSMHSRRVNHIPPCGVNNVVAIYNEATNMISVSADADFAANVTGEYRMSCVIKEDNVIGSGNAWGQDNYFHNGTKGNMQDPVSGFNWVGGGNPAAPVDFGGYDHVAVSLSNNDILGDAGSLPMNPTIGTHNHDFTDVSGDVIGNWATGNVHAVVMIVDANTNQIINAGETVVDIVTSTEEIADLKFAVKVFPNPTANNADVTFTLENSTNVKMDVYNAMGSLVYSKDAGRLTKGDHKMAFNGSDLNSGFYFVNVTIGNNVITKKVTLNK